MMSIASFTRDKAGKAAIITDKLINEWLSDDRMPPRTNFAGLFE